jgi:hypothetical protein
MAEAQAASEWRGQLPFSLQASETVLQVCKRHWVYLWPHILLLLTAAIAPIVAAYLILDLVGVDWGSLLTVVAAVWVLFWLVKAYLAWYQYHHDVWVITNQRLVDAFKKNPFNLRVASADLVNVQDISIDRSGILATTLDFGDITCQTAGTAQSFKLTGIPDPRDVQLLIDRERDRERMRTPDRP